MVYLEDNLRKPCWKIGEARQKKSRSGMQGKNPKKDYVNQQVTTVGHWGLFILGTSES